MIKIICIILMVYFIGEIKTVNYNKILFLIFKIKFYFEKLI